ncbi:MAG: NAD(P)/FAD-dependent oxidoreductase [Thermoplasmata archaeon]|nr:NAD(P)/FAD-dependent oxidoreductase [Thermoplasmata archaeon]
MPGFPRLKEEYDLVVLGGGHAGLQAGLKAALLHHTAAVIDRGPKYSRSFYAPRMDNIPGFPEGISGHKLLDLQIAQVRQVEERVGYFTPAHVVSVKKTDTGFEVTFDWLMQRKATRARAVVLALGVVDRVPDIGGAIEPIFPWANFAIVEFCIFCDGHTFPGKHTAVFGHDQYAARTALDLLHFGAGPVEILTNGRPFLSESDEPTRASLRAELDSKHITWSETAIAGFGGIREKALEVKFADGSTRHFDRGFSALGWYTMNSEIPRSLGCDFDPDGYVVTDEDCRALAAATHEPIPGLYCVGDLRNGWNQIPEAWATAERAVIHAYSWYL